MGGAKKRHMVWMLVAVLVLLGTSCCQASRPSMMGPHLDADFLTRIGRHLLVRHSPSLNARYSAGGATAAAAEGYVHMYVDLRTIWGWQASLERQLAQILTRRRKKDAMCAVLGHALCASHTHTSPPGVSLACCGASRSSPLQHPPAARRPPRLARRTLSQHQLAPQLLHTRTW